MVSIPIEDLPQIMLSGNFPDEITISHNLKTTVQVIFRSELIISEEYDPDDKSLIRLRLKELYDSLLETDIPLTGDLYNQSKSIAYCQILVHFSDLDILDRGFHLIKGGIDSPIIDCANFLKSNFLTWKPQVKKVQYLDPQWLTYFNNDKGSKVYIQATYLENEILVTSDPYLLHSLIYNYKYTINTKFDRLWQPFTAPERIPYFIDVWIGMETGEKVTYVQRYVLSNDYFRFNDLFIFENSLGGIDVIRFTGELERKIDNEVKSAILRNGYREYAVTINHIYTKNTGYFKNVYEILWTSDFFSSINRYHVVNNQPNKILVKSHEAKDIKGELNSYEFTFSYSQKTKYLNNETISDQLPSITSEFYNSPMAFDDIYVRVFGDQSVDGVKTFLQPIKSNIIEPASGDKLYLNGLLVEEGGVIDCGIH